MASPDQRARCIAQPARRRTRSSAVAGRRRARRGNVRSEASASLVSNAQAPDDRSRRSCRPPVSATENEGRGGFAQPRHAHPAATGPSRHCASGMPVSLEQFAHDGLRSQDSTSSCVIQIDAQSLRCCHGIQRLCSERHAELRGAIRGHALGEQHVDSAARAESPRRWPSPARPEIAPRHTRDSNVPSCCSKHPAVPPAQSRPPQIRAANVASGRESVASAGCSASTVRWRRCSARRVCVAMAAPNARRRADSSAARPRAPAAKIARPLPRRPDAAAAEHGFPPTPAATAIESTSRTSASRSGTAASVRLRPTASPRAGPRPGRTIVTSTSWPTAEITGTGQSASARATRSSLNAHRSSRGATAAADDHHVGAAPARTCVSDRTHQLIRPCPLTLHLRRDEHDLHRTERCACARP